MGLINTGQPFTAEDISQIAQDKDDVQGWWWCVLSKILRSCDNLHYACNIVLLRENKIKLHTKCLQVADHTSYE